MKKLTSAALLIFSFFGVSANSQDKSSLALDSTNPIAVGGILRVSADSSEAIRVGDAALAMAGDPQPLPASSRASTSAIRLGEEKNAPGESGKGLNPLGVNWALTESYRVGVGDVLDVRLPEIGTTQSTLYTVIDGGLLDFPLVSNPVKVAGLTTDEIAALLAREIKFLENPQVVVNVRDYGSHYVNVAGFVAAPGARALRREAVPLYVVLSEARLLSEATWVVINRVGQSPIVLDLADRDTTGTLVLAGDEIKVAGMPLVRTEYFYAGGAISTSGQKPYHPGMTLTQAIMASGGITTSAGNMVRITRQGEDGLLITSEYDLGKITEGRTPDPLLKAGDRIEVVKLP